jgi:hypothetical protein
MASCARCSTNAISRSFRHMRSRLVRAAARLLGGHGRGRGRGAGHVSARARGSREGDMPAARFAAQAWLTTVMQHLAVDRLRRRPLDAALAAAMRRGSRPHPTLSASRPTRRWLNPGRTGAAPAVAARLSLRRGRRSAAARSLRGQLQGDRAGQVARQRRLAVSSCIAHCCGCGRATRRGKTAARKRSSMCTGRRCTTAMRARLFAMLRQPPTRALLDVGCDHRTQVRCTARDVPGDADRRTARPRADAWRQGAVRASAGRASSGD